MFKNTKQLVGSSITKGYSIKVEGSWFLAECSAFGYVSVSYDYG